MAEPLDIQIPWPGWHAVRRLGRGSYGSVWEIERDVAGIPERCAMKVVSIPPEGGYDDSLDMGYGEESITAAYDESADAVLREYQIMAELSHPNVVSCKDVDNVPHADAPGYDIFIRMELLEPLPKWLKGRDARPSDAARVGRDIARALAACESRGIVHRDVKPANIMADGWGTFKLGDFGIARAMEGTMTATMAGTATYMAPEVAGGHYGRTVDIYSLGLVMWWMLGGYRLPFMPEGRLSAGDAARAEAKRLSGEPVPAPDGCPAELSHIVLKACAYRSEDRYQSASEMAAELDAFLMGGRPVQDPEDSPTDESMQLRPPAPSDTDWGGTQGATVGKGFGGIPANTQGVELDVATIGNSWQRRPESSGKMASQREQDKASSGDSSDRQEPQSVAPSRTSAQKRTESSQAGDEGAARIEESRVSAENPFTFSDDGPWIPCDYSSVTSSPAIGVAGVCDDGAFVLRCRDGATVIVTDGDADQDLLDRLSAWTNLRKVRFGEYRSSRGLMPYALGQRDDGSFVTTWDELGDAIASDTSGSWSGIADFTIPELFRVDAITDSGKWQRLEMLPDGSDWLPRQCRPALAFPANANGTDIVLLQDGTCWSTYEEGNACGDTIRSWTGIVQCIDAGDIYAAVGSDGKVHATTWRSEDDDEYEKCLRLAEGVASWRGIRKLDGIVGTFLGITDGGDVLLGEFDYWEDAPVFRTYDLGLSGIVDAAIAGYSDDGLIVAIDDNGNVAIASVGELEEARSAISIRRQELR